MVVLGLLVQIDMNWGMFSLLLVTLVLLALNPMIVVPRILGRGLTTLTGVTLFVYLLHEIIVFFVLKAELSQPVTAGLVLILSFAAAIMAQRLFDNVFDRWSAETLFPWFQVRFSGRVRHSAVPEEDDAG